MKTIRYLPAAVLGLRRHRSVASRILSKIERYAATGAGDVKSLSGTAARRLRVGNFRVVFEETDNDIIVTLIGPRGSIYEGDL